MWNGLKIKQFFKKCHFYLGQVENGIIYFVFHFPYVPLKTNDDQSKNIFIQ